MGYEFSTEENKVMNTLFIRYLVIGILIALSMVVYVLGISELGFGDILQAVLVIGGAVLFVLPFFKFRTITLTEGHDIDELMKALKGMAIAFFGVALLTVINLIVMFVNL